METDHFLGSMPTPTGQTLGINDFLPIVLDQF